MSLTSISETDILYLTVIILSIIILTLIICMVFYRSFRKSNKKILKFLKDNVYVRLVFLDIARDERPRKTIYETKIGSNFPSWDETQHSFYIFFLTDETNWKILTCFVFI